MQIIKVSNVEIVAETFKAARCMAEMGKVNGAIALAEAALELTTILPSENDGARRTFEVVIGSYLLLWRSC